MSTKNDLNNEQLICLSNKLISDFGSIENIKDFYWSKNRKECGDEIKLRYNISFYYFRKIIDLLGIPPRPFNVYDKQRMTKTRDTCDKLYGGIGFASEELNNKSKDTCEKLHGDRNYNNREQFKQTSLEKYGVDNPSKSPDVIEKIKLIQFENNDGKYTWNSLKQVETLSKLYGVKNSFQIDWVREKCLSTDTRIKAVNTTREVFNNKYGCWYTLTDDFKKKAKSRYLYDGENFDSSWELALWIYAKDHGEEIQHEPVSFEYTYDGELHYFWPDFRYNGKLIELKGDYFFNENGTMCNPYDHSQDGLYEAKYQCGLQNNVEFLVYKDIEYVIKYIYNNYGRNYLKQFKR